MPQPRDALGKIQAEIQQLEQQRAVDHHRAPVLEALEAFHQIGLAPFQIPAHKGGHGVRPEITDLLTDAPFRADAPLSKGLDDRKSRYELMAYAQRLAADAFGSEQAYFSTNGSTLSVELAVTTVAGPGEKILIERNIHKSVVSGLVSSGADAIWAVPELDEANAMSHCVTAATVRRHLDEHPTTKAVLVVSPTYFGAAADVRGIAEVCHERKVPLIIDDAWGAHFPFHRDLPDDPVVAGADLVISSFHKSIPALMQCSVVNLQGDLIDRDRFALAYDSMETTSTSILLIASMDGARRQMVLHGHDQLDGTIALARQAAERIGALDGLRVLGPEIVDGEGVADFDPTKLTVDLTDLGINGHEASDWLYEECRVGPELDDHRHLMFLVTIADDQASIDRLVDGMERLVAHAAGRPPLGPMAWAGQLLTDAEYVGNVRESFLGPVRAIPLAESVGELAAEPVSPYPPGVPVVVPGQRITQEIVDFLKAGLDEDMLIKGVADPSLETIRVVAGR